MHTEKELWSLVIRELVYTPKTDCVRMDRDVLREREREIDGYV